MLWHVIFTYIYCTALHFQSKWCNYIDDLTLDETKLITSEIQCDAINAWSCDNSAFYFQLSFRMFCYVDFSTIQLFKNQNIAVLKPFLKTGLVYSILCVWQKMLKDFFMKHDTLSSSISTKSEFALFQSFETERFVDLDKLKLFKLGYGNKVWKLSRTAGQKMMLALKVAKSN